MWSVSASDGGLPYERMTADPGTGRLHPRRLVHQLVVAWQRDHKTVARAPVLSLGCMSAALDDGLAATRSVAEHARELHGDTALAGRGDSAGGNIAAVTALRAGDEGGPSLCAQLLIYPVINNAY